MERFRRPLTLPLGCGCPGSGRGASRGLGAKCSGHSHLLYGLHSGVLTLFPSVGGRVTASRLMLFKVLAGRVRLVQCLPKPNYSFKGTPLARRPLIQTLERSSGFGSVECAGKILMAARFPPSGVRAASRAVFFTGGASSIPLQRVSRGCGL